MGPILKRILWIAIFSLFLPHKSIFASSLAVSYCPQEFIATVKNVVASAPLFHQFPKAKVQLEVIRTFRGEGLEQRPEFWVPLKLLDSLEVGKKFFFSFREGLLCFFYPWKDK